MKHTLAVVLLLCSGGCEHFASTAESTTPPDREAEVRFEELVADLESQIEQAEGEHAAAFEAADRAEAAARLAEAAAATTSEARGQTQQTPPKTIREPDASSPPGWERVGDEPSAGAKQPAPNPAAAVRSKALEGYDFLYFTAGWCAACRQQEPVLQQLVQRGYRVGLVDVDRAPELTAAFGVTAIPAYVAAVNGQTVLSADGRPKISHGTSVTPQSNRPRVDVQAVLDLLPVERRRTSRLPASEDAVRTQLKERAARHDWRTAPVYVDFPGNLNPQDYVEHLVQDHGFTHDQHSGWSAFELFQLHSAVHCPHCRVGLATSAPSTSTVHQYAEAR